MPNWCSNTMTIRGAAKDIAAFKSAAKAEETDLSLAKLYPEPDYSKVKVEPTFPSITPEVRKGEEWWDWRIQNWGTKWDIDAQLVTDTKTCLSYQFDSAWSPPVQWLEKVSKDFPSLSFRLSYEEPGVGFEGYATAKDGSVNDNCSEMN